MTSRILLVCCSLALIGGCADVNTVSNGNGCDPAMCDGACIDDRCQDLCAGVTCNDDNDCTSDECNPLSGECQFSNLVDDTACLEGAGLCVSGECVDQERCDGVDCTTAAVCLAGACDPTDGSCAESPVADDTECDFGVLPGLCKSGACVDAQLCVDVDCNDGDFCTENTCIPETGLCSSVALACDDDDACTTDSCDSGSGCVNVPKDCGDGNVCTADSCDDGACVSTDVANGTNCASTSHCTGGGGVICIPIPGSCLRGSCFVCSSNGSCSDLNSCTSDTCTDGRCSYVTLPNGASCSSNGNPGQCLFGRCQPTIITPF